MYVWRFSTAPAAHAAYGGQPDQLQDHGRGLHCSASATRPQLQESDKEPRQASLTDSPILAVREHHKHRE